MALRKGLSEHWKKARIGFMLRIALPLNFHWLNVCTKEKDLHPENMPLKLGKEAVPRGENLEIQILLISDLLVQ